MLRTSLRSLWWNVALLGIAGPILLSLAGASLAAQEVLPGRVVGRAGVGVDNIDLAAATERGVAVINVDDFMVTGLPKAASFIYTVVNGLSAGIGFTIALILMAAIRERLDLVDIPKPMRGIPITFIVAGLMAIAFMGFAGLKIG